jgi:internalin A
VANDQARMTATELREAERARELQLIDRGLIALPPEITELTDLHTLRLNDNQFTSLPPEIGQLTDLQWLDVRNNQLTSLPPELGQLSNLHTLHLGENQLTSLPPELTQLSNLQLLDLGHNQLTSLPPEITQLTNLRALYLHGNQLTSLPPELAQLINLDTLDLSGNQLTYLSLEITRLLNLQELYLSGNQLTDLPPEITRLTKLHTLRLRDNQFPSLPLEITRLSSLELVDLSHNQFTSLPPQLGELLNLRVLYLHGNQLTGLPPEITRLTKLHTLRLRGNQFSSLPCEIGQLSSLVYLSLAGNQLTSLPPELAQLSNLQHLALDGNQLTVLPAELGQLTNLLTLDLAGNQLVEPLPGLVAQGPQAVLAYLRSLDDAEPQYDAKLLLVGEGEAGKSSLIARLRGEEFLADRATTHGIELNQLHLHHPTKPVTITLHTWDFGGQPLYQATHQLFITPQALYLLVWDARQGDAEQVDTWLRRIRLLVGDQARVLLVATRADEHHAELDYPSLAQRYGTVLAGLHEVDNRSGTGLEQLRMALASQAARLPQMGEQVSRRWTVGRDRLLARSEPQLAYQAYVEVCAEHGVQADQANALLGLLHRGGQLLHYAHDPDLDQVVILQPEWLTKAISYVLQDPPTKRVGVLEHARLREIWQAYPAPLHRYLLRLMEKFDVSYRLGDPYQPSNQTASLIGQLVPHSRPSLPWQFDHPLAPGIRELAVRLVAKDESREQDKRLALKNQTGGLMAWLIVRNHRFTTGRYWRDGVFLALADGFDSEGLLELSADGCELALTVRAPNPTYFFFVLLDGVRSLLHVRWPGLAYDLLVPCQHRRPDQRRCTGRFQRDALVQVHQDGEFTMRCSVCGIKQDVALLWPAVAAASGADPRATVELNARHIQALQGGMQQVLDELAPMARQLGRIETGLTGLTEIADFTRTQLRLWTIRYENTNGTPRLFTLTPVNKKGLDKVTVWQDPYQLTLWCEHDDQPHPWPPASYQFTRPREWLVTVAPYAVGVLRILRLAAEVTLPIATLADVNLSSIKDDLEAMSKLLQQLPATPPHRPADPGEPAQAVQADGPELRTLRALLTELDPTRTFNGMHVVATSSGDFRWVCQDHFLLHNPGLPSVPA